MIYDDHFPLRPASSRCEFSERLGQKVCGTTKLQEAGGCRRLQVDLWGSRELDRASVFGAVQWKRAIVEKFGRLLGAVLGLSGNYPRAWEIRFREHPSAIACVPPKVTPYQLDKPG